MFERKKDNLFKKLTEGELMLKIIDYLELKTQSALPCTSKFFQNIFSVTALLNKDHKEHRPEYTHYRTHLTKYSWEHGSDIRDLMYYISRTTQEKELTERLNALFASLSVLLPEGKKSLLAHLLLDSVQNIDIDSKKIANVAKTYQQK